MLIKNGRVHDGLGKVRNVDIRIIDGKIAELGKGLELKSREELFDAKGMEILPGFIHVLSNWGVNGSWTEIRPSSNDNDEKSDPITPELDAFYAFNGRAATGQQLGAFGITACGVSPTDNNLFGGQIAAFTVDGVNPYKMCLRRSIGMKASVLTDMKLIYGERNMAPQTRMWIFSALREQLRKGKDYLDKLDAQEKAKSKAKDAIKAENEKKDETPQVERDIKLEAIGKVITGELPLFISCDSNIAIERVREIIKPYKKIKLVLVNGYGLDGTESWIIKNNIPLIVKTAGNLMDETPKSLDFKAVAKLLDKGALIALGGTLGSLESREDMLWNSAEMMRVVHDSEKVLPLITINPARILGIDDLTGSIEVGKRADIVIWSKNPMERWDARVVRTFMGGETIYREGDKMKCM